VTGFGALTAEGLGAAGAAGAAAGGLFIASHRSIKLGLPVAERFRAMACDSALSTFPPPCCGDSPGIRRSTMLSMR